MTGSEKTGKAKTAGLIITIAFHIFAAIVLFGISFGFAEKIEEKVEVSIWDVAYLTIGLISFIIVCIFVSAVKSRGYYILISFLLPFLSIFSSVAIIGETEIVPFKYMEMMASGIYLIFSLIVSLGALHNWFKKKEKKADWDSDVYVGKSLSQQIYEEFGNFDKF